MRFVAYYSMPRPREVLLRDGVLGGRYLIVNDKPAIDVEELCGNVDDLNGMLARCSRRHGKLVRIGLVVVDCLQLVTISGKESKDRLGQEQEILYRLVRLAFERFCHVVVLSRMPRFSHSANTPRHKCGIICIKGRKEPYLCNPRKLLGRVVLFEDFT